MGKEEPSPRRGDAAQVLGVGAQDDGAFAAHHEAALDAANHVEFVEAFLVQLGSPDQRPRILELLRVRIGL